MKGKPSIGRSDGQFISKRAATDKLILESEGDTAAISARLGTDWTGPLVRIDVHNPLLHNARLPSGLEAEASRVKFLWGGNTSGGAAEIIVNQMPATAVTITEVSPP